MPARDDEDRAEPEPGESKSTVGRTRSAGFAIPGTIAGTFVAVAHVAGDPETALGRLWVYLFPRVPEHGVSRLREIWLTIAYVLRRWIAIDRASRLSATLSLQTLLSVVPAAGLLLIGVGLIGGGGGGTLLQTLAITLFPDPERAANIADWITKSAANVTVPQLGVAGFLIALATASLLFGTLERTANQIWGVTRQRSPVAKFTMFYTIATLGPLIIIYSVAQPIVTRVAEQTFVPTPVLTTGLGLTLLNRFVPATHVRWPAALAGGVVSALLFEVGKWGFGHYLAAVTTYEGIYGSLSLMPVFTVWTYVSWMIVLLGVELAFVAQHLEVVRSEGYVNPTLRRDTTRVVSTARIAARVLLAVCDHYDRHSKGLRLADLEDRYQVGLSRLIDITNRLEEAKLLLETADEESCFVPARPLDLLLVRDVVALFDAGDIDNARKDERLSAIFADVDAFQARSIGSLNYQELVEQARAQRERTDERPEI
ncbi:MAG: YihY/virulence factor BrkB family protein [Nannocystaceae bacterium]